MGFVSFTWFCRGKNMLKVSLKINNLKKIRTRKRNFKYSSRVLNNFDGGFEKKDPGEMKGLLMPGGGFAGFNVGR